MNIKAYEETKTIYSAVRNRCERVKSTSKVVGGFNGSHYYSVSFEFSLGPVRDLTEMSLVEESVRKHELGSEFRDKGIINILRPLLLGPVRKRIVKFLH